MKIIQIDNYAREIVSDILIAENIKHAHTASVMCEALNTKYSGEQSAVFFKVVPDDHKLHVFEV